MLLPAVGESSLFHATSSLFHVESGQVKSVWNMFGYNFVNKLHLGSSLRSPSVDRIHDHHHEPTLPFAPPLPSSR